MELREFENSIEAIVFASGEPVSATRIAAVLNLDKDTVLDIGSRLSDKYSSADGGIRFLILGDSFQMTTAPQYADCVHTALESRKPSQLSKTSLEVLAIVAYYQPVTRTFIEQVRGTDSAYTVSILLDKGLIEECGRLDAPGRPVQFRTSKDFLRTFGISSLDMLPKLPEKDSVDNTVPFSLPED